MCYNGHVALCDVHLISRWIDKIRLVDSTFALKALKAGYVPKWCAPVAQLDRAFACGAKGRRFESCRAYQNSC